MTENLRYGTGLPCGRSSCQPSLDFSQDGDYAGAVEMCNGMGTCRKLEGSMCPSYMATRDEEHSTRGRANLLRAALSGQLPEGAISSQRLYQALDLCLECKACKAECESGVDMARLKAEFLDNYYKSNRRPLRNKVFRQHQPNQPLGQQVCALVQLGCKEPPGQADGGLHFGSAPPPVSS